MPTYSAGEASLAIVPDARGFKDRLEADLKRVNAEYAVQITADLARARADLSKFRAEQEGRAIKLRAEVDRDHLRKSFNDMRGDFENLGKTLGSALKIDTAAVGIDLLPSLATGLAGVTQALQQLAEAGLAVPGVLAGVGASVGTLVLGLNGVKDAWSQIDKVASASGADQARIAEQATAATNALTNAKFDEAQAQKDVAQAYKDARNSLEDLNIQQRGGLLSEKEAILGAAKARQDLATGRYKDAIDYQEAQLRVEEADQRVVEARQHNIELGQKISDQNAKGIQGADNVVAANERLVRSHQAVAQAQSALSDQAGETPAAKAADAMAKLAPNARQFVQTMIDLKPAFVDLRNTDAQNLFAGWGASLKTLVGSDLPLLKSGIGSIATALNTDLKQLFGSLGSDSTKGLLDRILGNTANADTRIKAAIDPLVHAVGVLTAAGSSTLPRLADAVGAVADRFNKFITAAAADGRLDAWINEGLTAFTHLGDIAIHVGESFNAISKALGGQGLLADLDHLTEKLSTFLNSGRGQQELTRFFQEGREEFAKWKPVIDDMAKMLPTLFQSAHQTAETFLPVIKEITDTLAQNPTVLKEIVDGFLLWKTVLEPIGAVAKAIGGVTKVTKALIDSIGGVGEAAKTTATTVEAASAAEVASEEKVAASALEADAALGSGGGAGRLARLGSALGPLAGPLGVAAAGGALIYGELSDEDEKGKQFQRDMAAAKTPEEREEIQKRYFGNKYTPPTGPGSIQIKPGSMVDRAAWQSEADKGNPVAKWIVGAKDDADFAKRVDWFTAHQDDASKPDFKPPASYHSGGATPSGSGPGPTGGFPVEVHGDEWVISKYGRSKQSDAFWDAANKGTLPRFDVGGPIDVHGDPRNAGPNPASLGPQQIAPNPTSSDGGMSVAGALTTAAGSAPGAIVNAINLISSAQSQGAQDGQGDAGGADIHSMPGFDVGGPVGPGNIAANNFLSGFGSGAGGLIGNVTGLIQRGQQGGLGGGEGSNIPGLWGLAASASDPNKMQAWQSQTLSWLGNFAGKTLSKGMSTVLPAVLSQVGLGNSILSPSNPWNQALTQGAGFYLGDQSPLMSGGGGSADLSGSDIGSADIPGVPGASIPTYKTAGAPSGSAGLPGDAGLVAGAATPTGDLVSANPASRAAIPLGGTTTSAVQRAGLNPLYKPGTSFSYGQAPPPGAGVPPSIMQLADKFGLEASTYPTGGSLHQAGYAFDFRPKGGDFSAAGRAKMDQFSQFIKDNLSSQTLELIHYDPGTAGENVGFDPSKGQYWGIAGAQDVDHPGDKYQGYFTKGDEGYAGHSDHVHWATDAPVIITPAGQAAPAGGHTAPTAAPTGSGPQQWAPLFRQVLQQLNLPEEPWLSLGLAQMSTESGGTPTALNASGASGLMQVKPGTFNQYHSPLFPGGINDPASNIAAAILYTQSRYGGPTGVWGIGKPYAKGGPVPKLYDKGGMLPTGLSLVDNQTTEPEAVLNPEQHQAYKTVADHLPSFFDGGGIPTGLATPVQPNVETQTTTTTPTPQPVQPQAPAQHLQQSPGPSQAPNSASQAPKPAATPEQPQAAPDVPPPSPISGTPEVPPSTPTGGELPPGLHPADLAPAPTNLDHNLKAVDTGIDSAAQAIGQAASTAIGIAGSSGFTPGAGAIGPYVAGLIQEGGKVAKDVVNIGSSFLVGNVTNGTQDLAYGSPLRPAQNLPNVSSTVNTTNISGNYELRAAMEANELKNAQDSQTYYASHGRITA
jgi:Transglycosylase SLT domain